jgi:hypothetical protein
MQALCCVKDGFKMEQHLRGESGEEMNLHVDGGRSILMYNLSHGNQCISPLRSIALRLRAACHQSTRAIRRATVDWEKAVK